ncbi:MAG: hypothetical protein QF464_05370 [Myxococcota bacterium]|nr:hypothetical protein [Myxococcota bacterium]
MLRTNTTAVAVALSLLFGSCADDMAAADHVVNLRVLAIRAAPPEVRAPEGDGFALTSVDALVVGGVGEVSYTWSLCFIPGPVVNGMVCLDPEAEVSLGEGPTATIPVPSPELLLSRAPPEFEGFEIDLSSGVPVQIQLDVTDESGRSVTALKKIIVSSRSETNTNPTLDGITFNGLPWEDDEIIPFNEDLSDVDIVPQWSDATLETYDDQGVEATETLLFSWFMDDETSELIKQRTSGVVPENTFSPGPLEEQDERLVTLWLVARDDRGGVTWLTRQLRITPGN